MMVYTNQVAPGRAQKNTNDRDIWVIGISNLDIVCNLGIGILGLNGGIELIRS